MVIYGVLLIIVMIFYPGGAAQLYSTIARRIQRRAKGG
jgi:hypothetical protein